MEALKLIDYLAEGFKGPAAVFMWASLLLGMFGAALVVERMYYIYFRSSFGRHKFMSDLFKLIKTGDFQRAIRFTAEYNLPIAKLMSGILLAKDQGANAIERAIDEIWLTETPKLMRYTPLIGMVANLATLMGLLGTVFGLIMSFDAVANVPAAQRSQALAAGIAVAMTATAFGLGIAIVCLFFHGIIVNQTERVQEEMDEKSKKISNILVDEVAAKAAK